MTRMREGCDVYSGLVGKAEGKRPPGRRGSRREDNIVIDVKEMRWGGLDLSGLEWGEMAGSCEYGNVFLGFTKCLRKC